MCDIYKRDTARKQFGLDSTIGELQEDNNVKHTWKIAALSWKASDRMLGHRCHLILHLSKIFGSFSR